MTMTSKLTRAVRRGFGALLCAAAAAAGAQTTFPDKPVRIVVPAPPGGTLDVVARILAEALQPALGQPVIVDNKAGGVGMVGVQELLSAPRDGHTVMVHISGIVSEIPHLAKPRYDPFKDIKPIAELTRSGLVFIGGPQLPAQTLKDVVAWVRAHPGTVNYASYTTGTIGHTSGAEFNALAKLDMSHIGYKGSAPALQDVMGGHVPLMFDGAATSVPLVKAGRVKAFAVTNAQRLAALPNVPTFAELGYPDMTQEAWVGLWVAPDVPAPVQAKLRELVLKALQQPKLRERITELGMEVGKPSTSDDMAKALRTAFDRQAALLKSINFKPE